MKKNLVLTSMLLVLAAPLTAEQIVPESAGDMMLTIHVINGTEGGSVAEGTPVTVAFYQQGKQIKNMTGLTDNEGNCTVGDIPTGSDIVAVAQAKHSGMLFSGSPLMLTSDQRHFDITVQVFDVTFDSSLIGVGTHHLIIKRHDGGIRVTEYLQLTNDLDKAIFSDTVDADGKPKVIQISLPKGFENLTFSNYFHSDAVIVTESGFYDTMAIPPGQYHGVFSYDVEPLKGTIDFTKEITLPQDNVMAFVQAEGMIVTGLGQPDGQMALTDGVLTDYYTVDAAHSSVLKFQIEVLETESPGQQTWLILSIVFAAIILAVAARLMRR